MLNMNVKANKLFALLLVGLFFGSSLAVLAGNSSGNDEGNELGVVLKINDPEKRIAKDEIAMYGIVIENIGSEDDTYRIAFGGKDYRAEGISVQLVNEDEFLDGEAEPIDPDNLSIAAGENAYLFLLITIERERGSYEISMMVQSKSDESIWDAGKTITHIIEENHIDYDFTLVPIQKEIVTGYNLPAIFTITLKNTGNVEDSYLVNFDHSSSYFNVDVYLTEAVFGGSMWSPFWEGPYEDGNSLTFYLGPGQERQFMLHVIVYDIRDGEGDEGTFESGDYEEPYFVNVNAMSLNGIEILKTVETKTIIKESSGEQLSFTCYDPETSIEKGGTSEFILNLNNHGWSYAEVAVNVLEHDYPDINAELFLISPYFLMGYDDPDDNYPGTNEGTGGAVLDANGDYVYLTEDDIAWDDFGGLIPVEEGFTYRIAPHETVQFLLRVTHLHEGEEGDVSHTMFSAHYDIGVSAESENGYKGTVITNTQVIFQPLYGLNMWLKENRQVTVPYQPVEYIITLKNTGNVEEVVDLKLGGSAYMMEGVEAYLYAFRDWPHYKPGYPEPGVPGGEYPIYTDPIIIYTQDGSKDFYDGQYGCNELWASTEPLCMPEPRSDGLQVTLGAGQEMKIVLWVYVIYYSGSFEISVKGVVPEHPETAHEVFTETVIKEVEYKGFEMNAPVTEQTALAGENVDYFISIFNPGYYSDKIILELGGKDLNTEGVEAQLFLKENVYYYEPANGEFLRKENADYQLMGENGIYDPSYQGENEIREKYPEYDDEIMPWLYSGDETMMQNGYENGYPADEEYIIGNSGAIYKNYDYEYEIWNDPDSEFREDDWLVPIPLDDNRISIGPFEEVWLLLRVNVEKSEGMFNIDLLAHSALHPEYKKIVNTETTIMGEAIHGLDLFIGDPEHYTAYGITTVYVFQLTNTGNIRDTVQLTIEGEDAANWNIHVDIGVHGIREREPMPMIDERGNLILPDDSQGMMGSEEYYYNQWAGSSGNDYPGDSFANGEEFDDFEKQYATADGEIILPSASNTQWVLPVEYVFMNWDTSEARHETPLDEIIFRSSMSGWETEGNPGEAIGSADDYFDLDTGFMPYNHYDDKFIELEPNETVVVSMKVTVFNWDIYTDNPDDPSDIPRPLYDPDGQLGIGNTDDRSMNGDPDDKDETSENNSDGTTIPVKDGYELILVAASHKSPATRAEARTVTHIYDDEIIAGINASRISGVFNVFERMFSYEILEAGFDILPILLESGKIEFNVSGEFSDGRVVVLNLDQSNLDELGSFEVLFDGLTIEMIDVGEIIHYHGSDARYAVVDTESGLQLLIYIPHFSEHAISVKSIQPGGGEESEFNGSILIIGLLMGVVVGVFGFSQRQKKQDLRRKEFKLKLHEEVVKAPEDYFKPLFMDQKPITGNNTREKTDDVESLLNESLFIESFEKKD